MSEAGSEVGKIVLIDDEKEVSSFFSKVFENFKHVRFFSSSRARHGIEIAKRERPNVVLLDLQMPEINGEEALKELKPLLPGTRFIMMTGWDDGATKNRIVNEIGVDAYFEKPVDLEKVMAKIFELMMVK